MACRFLGIARSTARYKSKRPGDLPLRTRLAELAGERPRWGYRRLHVLLHREGELVNRKRVYRVYTEAGQHGSLGSRAASEFAELWAQTERSIQAGLTH